MLLGWLVAGCATSTIETRKKEDYGTYSKLTSEFKSAVDEGQIKVGMPMDAVYIAWGKPSQVLTNESAQGTFITWLYQNSRLKSYRYLTMHSYLHGDYVWREPYVATSYYPEEYVSAEVIFEDAKVKEWRTLPAPVY